MALARAMLVQYSSSLSVPLGNAKGTPAASAHGVKTALGVRAPARR